MFGKKFITIVKSLLFMADENTHEYQMQSGYSKLFYQLLDNAFPSDCVSCWGKSKYIAKVNAFSELEYLDFKRGAEPDFIFDGSKRVSFDFPAFIQIQDRTNENSKENIRFIAIIDNYNNLFSSTKWLRSELYYELASKYSLCRKRGILNVRAGKKRFLMYKLLADEYFYIYKDIISENAFNFSNRTVYEQNHDNLKNLVSLAKEYVLLIKDSMFNKEEENLEKLINSIARAYANYNLETNNLIKSIREGNKLEILSFFENKSSN